jgi:guanine nucleotide exchange factor VAV
LTSFALQADELYYASDFPKVIQTLSALSGTKAAGKHAAKFPAGAGANTATGVGGEDMYQSLEDLVGQSISFAEAAQSSAAFGVDDEEAEEDVYGAIAQMINQGVEGGDEDVYAAMFGAGGGGEAEEEDIYSKPEAGVTRPRDHVLAELEDTERRYVDVLKTIIEKFMRPLAAVKAISKMDHKTIFSNVTDLLTIHHEFHSLVSAQMASTTGRKLSEPFMVSLPKMRIYGQFCCDVPKAIEVINTLNKNKTASAAIEAAKAASGQRFNLKDLLNVPMQRVLKYPLLLKELIKATPGDHKDHPKLVNAKLNVDNLAETINKTKSDHDTLMGMIAGLTGYSGAPLQQYAPFVKDGDILYKDCKSSKKDEKKLAQRYGFLLQTAMVLTVPKKAKYQYKSLCLLNKDMTTHEVPFWTLPKDEQNSKFSFAWALMVGGEQIYVFSAKTLPAKKKWMTQMNQLIEDMGTDQSAAPTVGGREKPVIDDLGSGGGAKPPPSSKGYEEWTPMNTPPTPTTPTPGGADVTPKASATEDQWFAGKMGRPKAEKLFIDTPDGTFLIRESDRPPGGEYSLSVKYNEVIKHIKINRKGNMYDVAPDSKPFATIQEMVDHFTSHSLNRHFPGMETTLAIPFKEASRQKKTQLHGQSQSKGSGIGRARSRFAYAARSPDELTFERGVELTILSTDDPTLDSGWWKGTLPNGQIGIFPANYVQQLG